MNSRDLATKTMLYSKRFEAYGQCLEIRDYFAYMIFVKHPNGWYHASELEKKHP